MGLVPEEVVSVATWAVVEALPRFRQDMPGKRKNVLVHVLGQNWTNTHPLPEKLSGIRIPPFPYQRLASKSVRAKGGRGNMQEEEEQVVKVIGSTILFAEVM